MKWYTLYLKLCRKTLVLHNKLSYIWRETLYPHIWTRNTWMHHFITMGGLGLAKALANLYWSVCNKPGEWATTYSYARCINYISTSIIFGLDFKTVQGGIFFCLLFYCIPEQTIRRVKYADVCEWFSQINIGKIYFAIFINLLSLSIFKPLYMFTF